MLSLRNRILVTGMVTLLFWSNLFWDYFHQGVPSHYLLHREDLPKISNWWGGLVVPIVTWYLLYRIAKRLQKKTSSMQTKKVGYGFFGALFFSLILSFLFTQGSAIPDYMMLALFFVSFFVPLFTAEFLLGYILGMSYVFGGIIAIASGVVLSLVFYITYKVLRAGLVYLIRKSGLKK